MNTVKDLNGRLNTLKRRFLKNQLSASEIKEEVDAVSKDANNTLAEVQKLQDQYGVAEEKLMNRAGKSYTAKERAQRLFDRASQLFVNTNAKEKDLRGCCCFNFCIFSK